MIPEVSRHMQQRISRTGGLAPNGQPLFRVMRGCDRFTWIGGRWPVYDDSGNKIAEHIGTKEVLKYPEAAERYIFEVWCPPENYGSEADWKANFTHWIDGQSVEVLGPYPSNGEYEMVKVLEREYRDSKQRVLRKEFVPLTETLCDVLVETALANKGLPDSIRKESRRREFEADRKRRDDKLVAMIANAERPKFAQKDSYVIVPDMKEIETYG